MSLRTKTTRLVTFLAIFLIASRLAHATPPTPPPQFWPSTGLHVESGPGFQWTGDVVSDGLSGAYVAWTDQTSDQDSVDVYLQHVTWQGKLDWTGTPHGYPVCTQPGRQFLIRLVPDGYYGGVIAVWYDERGASADIYALRLERDGTPAPGWPADGLLVCGARGDQSSPVVAADGFGGAFIAWEDPRDGFHDHNRIYVQRVLYNGEIAPGWPPDGKPVTTADKFETEPALISGSDNDAFVSWVQVDQDGLIGDIYLNRITSSGSTAVGWPDSGRALCVAPGRQDMPSLVTDNAGGIFAVWRDYRDVITPSYDDPSDVYAQRVTEEGWFPAGWGGNGVPVRVDNLDQWIPKAASDGLGGLLVSWMTQASVFVQRLTSKGTLANGWPAEGVSVVSYSAGGQGPNLVGVAGSAFVTWSDFRNSGELDIYAQSLDPGGAVAWAEGGIRISSDPGHEYLAATDARMSSVVADNPYEGWLVAWVSGAEGNQTDIVLQRVTTIGTVGPWGSTWGPHNSLERLAPNPSSGLVRLQARMNQSRTEATVEVYDVHGRRMQINTYQGLTPGWGNPLDLDLSRYPSGVYFLRLSERPGGPELGRGSVVIVR